MDKNSVFFSIHSAGPKSSQRFYLHSNKPQSLNLVTYMTDPHSFDDIGSKNYNFVNSHDSEIFDIKKGSVDITKIEPVAKQSHVFSGIISFDDELSKKDIFKTHWQDLANIVFQTFIRCQDFNIDYWEMQANMHYNTNNKHIQFRIYQNTKTPENEFFNKKYIQKNTINSIKNNIFSFIKNQLKTKTPVLNYPHVLKGHSIYEYNKKIKENKALVEDFVELINLPNIDDSNSREKVMKIADLYYQRSWFPKWINNYLNHYDLLPTEKKNIENIIKNNILYEIYYYVQDNKALKVYDFIVKKDPHDKSSKPQKFKNFDKINQEVDFSKLATYTRGVIKMVYKEPISRFIDMVFANNQYNLIELETTLGNYLKQIRPNIKENVEIIPNQEFDRRYSDEFILDFVSCINTTNDEFKKSNTKFNKIVDKYYDNLWFDNWIKDALKHYHLNDNQILNIKNTIKNSILNELYFSIQSNWNQKLSGFDPENSSSLTLLEASKQSKLKVLENKIAFEKYLKWTMNSTIFDFYEIEDKINDYLKKNFPDKYKYVVFAPPKDDISSTQKNK